MLCAFLFILYTFYRHRAINLFLRGYRDQWLNREEAGHTTLIDEITVGELPIILPNKSLSFQMFSLVQLKSAVNKLLNVYRSNVK